MPRVSAKGLFEFLFPPECLGSHDVGFAAGLEKPVECQFEGEEEGESVALLRGGELEDEGVARAGTSCRGKRIGREGK
jgi:hypothetical protein